MDQSKRNRGKQYRGRRIVLCLLFIVFVTGSGLLATALLNRNSPRKLVSDELPTANRGKTEFNRSAPMKQAPKHIKIPQLPTPEDKVTSVEPAGPKVYDYSQPVPESDPVDESYFDDAVFIGNSRSEGIKLYSIIKNATVYATRGLDVSNISKERFIGDGKLTVMEALGKKQFGKVYIMLGLNELGWPSADKFANKYAEVIDQIRALQPNAQIYVQSIFPVSAKKSASDKIYNNSNVALFDQAVRAMCQEKQLYYVNVAEALVDETGALPEDAGKDGIHINKQTYERWHNYILKHTVNEEDYQ